jgi:hypothetical protein
MPTAAFRETEQMNEPTPNPATTVIPHPDQLTFHLERQETGYFAWCDEVGLLAEADTQEETIAQLLTALKLVNFYRENREQFLARAEAGEPQHLARKRPRHR